MSKFPQNEWVEIDGQRVPFTKPQHYIGENNEEVRLTGEKDPLPVKDKEVKKEFGNINQKLESQLDAIKEIKEEIVEARLVDSRVFGVHWDKSSDSTLMRTDDARGLVAEVGVGGEVVRNDFDDLPIWGEMEEVEDEFGNIFIRIPKFYIKKRVGKDFKSLQVSKKQHAGFYLPKVFWDFDNDKELDYFDYGKHEASISDDGTKLESKPEKQVHVQENINSFRNKARENGKGYQQNDIHAIDVIQTLFTIEFATLDSQSVVEGYVRGNYNNNHTAVISENQTNRVILTDAHAASYDVGQTLGIGINNYSNTVSGTSRLITDVDRDYDEENTAIYFDGPPVNVTEGDVVANRGSLTGFSKDIYASTGSLSGDSSPFIYRGIENLYGSVYEFVDGINIRNHKSWIAENADDYSSNLFAHPYKEMSYTNSENNGYTSEMGFDEDYPFAEFPIEVVGNASTYYADYYYQGAGNRVARFGGYWSAGSRAGLWFWSLTYSSGYASATSGGRLLRKPLN